MTRQRRSSNNSTTDLFDAADADPDDPMLDEDVADNEMALLAASNLTEFFGSGGALSKHLDGYELRPSQLEMAETVKRALLQQVNALIEAPTGTGKSIAYLVPAILSGKTIVVATANKSLQSQLYYKDIPFLRQVMNLPISAVIVKGRSNFICNHKWDNRDDFPLAKGTNGLHLMPYFTLGIVYVGPQFLIPIDGAPVEIAFNLGFKFPIVQTAAAFATLASNFSHMPSGRPLRVAGRARTAALRRGRGWKRGRSPRTRNLDPYTRTTLASHWADEARAEHASVATFAKLVLELLAVGAPASLVRRAQRAAADEIRHAETCFRFASAYAGVEIEPAAIETGSVRKPSLARMATEAFLDGCIGEGLAAATLRATESDDPVVRKALNTIARDEARHAALGRAIVRWCEKTGGAPVRRALRRAQSALGSGRLAGAG